MSIKGDEQGYYICGRCGTKQFYLLTSGPDSPCNVCGYLGLGRIHTILPSEVKMEIK